VSKNPLHLAVASAILVVSILVIWFGAPPLPVLIGAGAAVAIMYLRAKR
jgi:hypothetical protein